MNSDIRLFYITCPDTATCKKISMTLLEDGLIACANILPKMESLYHWDGTIQSSEEVLMILKSTQIQADRILQKVASLHPYNTPCILVVPVEKGHEPYIRWLSGGLY